MVYYDPRVFILLAVVCYSVTSIQPQEDFTLNINEGGSNFDEKITIDEEKETILFRVPQHNNVDGASFFNDFKLGLTITRVNLRKVCYVSRMDPDLSSPDKLKEDLIQASLQTDPLPVTTKSNLVMVTGPANRRLLSKEALEFCGMFPIHNVETFDKHSLMNATSGSLTRHRIARTIVKKYPQCNRANTMEYVEKCMLEKWDLSCKMQSHSCYYMVRCVNLQPRRQSWNCTETHLSNTYPICCDLICPLKS